MFQEQFIMAYGGLRGAVGFSLVLGIDKQQVRTTEKRTAVSDKFSSSSTKLHIIHFLNDELKKQRHFLF